MSSNERINFRFYHNNPKDMQALQGLKDIADEICEDIAEDGIYLSMKKHGLVD